jgi:hypothetical protein
MESSAVAILFRYIVIVSLKTKVLVTEKIVSSPAKIVTAVDLILMGTGALRLLLSAVSIDMS